MSQKRVRLVLGDQLSREISSLAGADPSCDIIVMGELADETAYVKHHKKKIALIFSAMRHFAAALRNEGFHVDYRCFDDETPVGSFRALISDAIEKHQPSEIIVTEPGERRLANEFASWREKLHVPVEILEDGRYLISREAFAAWAKRRKQLRMEFFYREMRAKTGFLMEANRPVGGQWNFDRQNRKPADSDLTFPQPPQFEPDSVTRNVIDLVNTKFGDHFGALEPFWFAVTRDDALMAIDHFIENALPLFGDFQDAMLRDQKFLFHSVLSIYINIGLLNPREVCERAESAYYDGLAPINAVEGFIRQIIGWREYMRGVYWLSGDYVSQNFFGADRPLPGFYWTGKTRMACIRATIEQTRDEAYAHHIQRLMVTGNFAMLAGVDPYEVHEWYLAVYADAFEWVEAPNVIGMSQFADGGALGSKPYAASGAYINRMSDYCKRCDYAVSKKTEEDACPFNALYWDFLARNEAKLKSNPRMAQMYRTWEKMDEATKLAYRAKARATLDRLNENSL